MSALRLVPGCALCIYSRARVLTESPLAPIWAGCTALGFLKGLNAEERPVMDMPLAEKAETSAH